MRQRFLALQLMQPQQTQGATGTLPDGYGQYPLPPPPPLNHTRNNTTGNTYG